MSTNRFTSPKAALLHQEQPRQPTPRPTSTKAAVLHAGQPQPPPRSSTAKAVFLNENAPVSTPQSLHFTIYVRSFESSARFARPVTSRGDNRTFTTKVGKAITARIHLQVDVLIDLKHNKIIFTAKYKSSETHQYCFPFYPFTFKRTDTAHPTYATTIGRGKYEPVYRFNIQAAEPIMAKIPLVGGVTPNISLHGFFSFSFINNDTLFIYGKVYGDGFPDAECFVVDASGKAVLLGTYKHGAMDSPIWDLPGDGNLQMMDINAAIRLDAEKMLILTRGSDKNGTSADGLGSVNGGS